MGFKEKMQARYAKTYLDKYGDKISQIQGNVISIKIEEKTTLWIFNKLNVVLLVKPDRSKSVVKCNYSKKKWFKKIPFMPINQGNLVIVQVMKTQKKKKKTITDELKILNIINLTNKKELFDTNGQAQKAITKYKRK